MSPFLPREVDVDATTGGDPSFRLGSRITARIPGWRSRSGRGHCRSASQDQRFCLATQDPDLHVVPGEIGAILGLVGHQLVQPAFGLVAVPQAMMGHGQEGESLGDVPAIKGLNALVQTTDGFPKPAGSI